MDEKIKDDCAPCRQKYTLSETWDKYKALLGNEYFRYRFDELDLSKEELKDLIEILTIRNDKT